MPDHHLAVFSLFSQCVRAIHDGELIQRVSARDKEFHFQNWVEARLQNAGLFYERGGRNSYPDFRLVNFAEGYEVKGLAYPGREATYDCNSQAPTGQHNGRTIFYIFGRYPAQPDGESYPLLDLVICHGDFLNADHEYVHKNKSVRGFGSYGDILIRDRKMYVASTPYGLLANAAHNHSLILPTEMHPPDGFIEVGALVRKETDEVIVGYHFDLKTNTIMPETAPNPSAGQEHTFRAWRLNTGASAPLSLRESSPIYTLLDDDAAGNDLSDE